MSILFCTFAIEKMTIRLLINNIKTQVPEGHKDYEVLRCKRKGNFKVHIYTNVKENS